MRAAPHPLLHPDHLVALGRVRGLPVRADRVLDVGCGDGTRLLAAIDAIGHGFGVDADVDDARATADALDAPVGWATTLPDETFDLVIATGPLDWPALAARLAPDGLLVARLDVLPGHRLLEAIRHMVDLHARRHRRAPEAALAELTAYARELQSPLLWDGVLVDLLGAADDPVVRDAILGDAAPATLPDHVAAAGAAGLAFLGDARLATSSRAMLPHALMAWVAHEAATDPVRAELIVDLGRNQHARLGLFGRRPVGGFDRDAVGELVVGPAHDDPLHWACGPTLVSRGQVTGAPAGTAEVLAAVADGFVPAASFPPAAVLAAVELGGALLRTRAPDVARRPPERPRATPLARLRATWGRTVPTREHRLVTLSDDEAAVLTACDGTPRRDPQLAALTAYGLLS